MRRRGRVAWGSLGIVCVFMLRALTVVRGGRSDRGRRPELAFRRRPVRRPPLRSAAAPAGVRDVCAMKPQFPLAVRPVALACARRARGRAAAFLHANSWAGPRFAETAFRCKPARGAIDSPYRRRARVSVCRRNVPWLRNCPSPRLSSEDKCQRLPVGGVQNRACGVEGGLLGRLKRKLPGFGEKLDPVPLFTVARSPSYCGPAALTY